MIKLTGQYGVSSKGHTCYVIVGRFRVVGCKRLFHGVSCTDAMNYQNVRRLRQQDCSDAAASKLKLENKKAKIDRVLPHPFFLAPLFHL